MQSTEEILKDVNKQLERGKLVLKQEGVLNICMLIKDGETTEVFVHPVKGIRNLLQGISIGLGLGKN